MTTALVRFTALILIATLAACGSDAPGSARMRDLTTGASLEEVVQQMGQGPLTASSSDTAQLVNGYRRMRYFIDGTTYQVLYSRDAPGDVTEPLLQTKETPLVFRNDSLVGWGWKYYVDEAMATFQLPTPLRAIDTMSTAPAP